MGTLGVGCQAALGSDSGEAGLSPWGGAVLAEAFLGPAEGQGRREGRQCPLSSLPCLPGHKVRAPAPLAHGSASPQAWDPREHRCQEADPCGPLDGG